MSSDHPQAPPPPSSGWSGSQAYPPPPAETYGATPTHGDGHGHGRACVLGILALLTSITVIGGVLLGIVAVVLGLIAARRAKRGTATGRGRAVAGIVTGAVGLVLAVALVAVGVSILNSKSGTQLRQCLNRAGSNQAAITACDNRFARSLTGG